jgi:hypothetical protein
MAREPHSPLRRVSMLIVATLWLAIGIGLLYVFLPMVDGRRSDFAVSMCVLGALVTVVGVRFIITALTPYRPGSQEYEEAEGEYPYTWDDRRRLRQWGDDHYRLNDLRRKSYWTDWLE